MSDSTIRNNPPDSVVTYAQLEAYKTLYDDITDNGVILQYHHRHALGELAVSMCEMKELRKLIAEEGYWPEVQGDRGPVRKKNAAVDVLEKLRPVILRIMKEFKMTPSSSGKVLGSFEGGKTNDGFDDRI